MPSVYVVEIIPGRNKVAIQMYPSREAAIERLCEAARTLLPKYHLRSFEKAAGLSGFITYSEDMTALSPATFVENNGFIFDQDKYAVFLSDTLSFCLSTQSLHSFRGRPRYEDCDPEALTPGSRLLVVTFNFMYGGQGTLTSIGVFCNAEVAACELWRETFGWVPDADTGGYELNIYSMTEVVLDDTGPCSLTFTDETAGTFCSEWGVKATSDAWAVFREGVVAALRALMPRQWAINSECRSVRDSSRVRVRMTDDTVTLAQLEDGEPSEDGSIRETVQSVEEDGTCVDQFDVFVNHATHFE